MISDLLDRSYVLSQVRAQRDWLADLFAKAKAGHRPALAALKKHRVAPAEIATAIAALDASLAAQEAEPAPATTEAFIPRDPILCSFQAGMTEMADRRANTAPAPSRARVRAAADTSPTEKLKQRSMAGTIVGPDRTVLKAPFVEGDDIHYGLDGFRAKFGALFKGRRKFNKNAARPAVAKNPLRLFLFGDWGTGLPLAQAVTAQIRRQLDAADGSRQPHVVHLGDVYYVGDPDEYTERVVSAGMWPVRGAEKEKIGSWSLNGNHDMYAGGHGYFDRLLRDGRFLCWHRDAAGEPSSFFVIEDAHWQIFGLDTSWNVPTSLLGSFIGGLFGGPNLKDYGGQNGILTREQVTWMAARRDASKGCVLLTHHQPASSRTSEDQHSEEAVKLLKKEGVYGQIDAWFWGHEHRCAIFKPKAQRTTPRLADAPEFCACIGHGGVPVTAKNFEADKKIRDVAWEENRLNASSPMYEGERVLPFGFARIDTGPGTLDVRIFDHTGSERYQTTFKRLGASAAGAHAAAGAKSAKHARKSAAPRQRARRAAPKSRARR